MERILNLLIDKYELTMNEVYIQNGQTDEYSYYDAYFRNIPFEAGYAITAGLDSIIDFVKNFRFDEEAIDYLRSLNNFSEEHLEYLRNFRFRGDIYAIPDGTPVFGNQPLLTIRANKIEANLLETIILAYFNAQIKFATATSRVVEAAGSIPVLEMGARRADGPYAAIEASKVAYMAGAAGTSNLAAGYLYGVPTSGTMAHSYVQDAIDEELANDEYGAFLLFAKVWKGDAVFLLDTYDTIYSGVPNAIRVYKEFLEPNGYGLKGVRIDSGNLLELSIKVRKMLDEAGLVDTKIVISNGLDAADLKRLRAAQAPIDLIGLGDNIVSPKERVGVVYKLVGKERAGAIIPRIKKSEDDFKTINPGYKRVYRFFQNGTNLALGDVIAGFDEIIDANYFNNLFSLTEQARIEDFSVRVQELQVPIFINGELVYEATTIEEKRRYCQEQIRFLPADVRAIETPGEYPVVLTEQVEQVKKRLIAEITRGVEKVRKIAM